jgi:hypothetical protein
VLFNSSGYDGFINVDAGVPLIFIKYVLVSRRRVVDRSRKMSSRT